MNYDRLVLAYHGTSRAIAERIHSGEPFSVSRNDHDWLGEGIYFWEGGFDRAKRWAIEKHKSEAAVVGALVQLGRCYDLMDTKYTRDLAEGAKAFDKIAWPDNGGPPRNRGKRRLRDCAVMNWWLTQLEAVGETFDTVRYGFEEGDPVHPEMTIRVESHVQIAVRNPAAIIGVFRPRAS